MIQSVRISSKRQITIPSRMFSALELDEGDFLVAEKTAGSITLTPAEGILSRLSGSVKIPSSYKNMSADEIIKKAKRTYFNGQNIR